MTANLTPAIVDGPIPAGPKGDDGIRIRGAHVVGMSCISGDLVTRLNSIWIAKRNTVVTPSFDGSGQSAAPDDWLMALDGRGTEVAGEIVAFVTAARDAALAAESAAQTAQANAEASERRIRAQDLGDFADDASALTWAAAQTPPISVVVGSSYWNTATKIKRICSDSTTVPKTFVNEDADAAVQRANAETSATAAQNALSDFLTRYVGAFNSTPTYVGSPAPWSVGALYWNKLQGKFFVWSGSTWTATDATAQQAKIDAEAAASSAAQIAVGLSYDEYTLDGVSALDQGAVISFPKGLFVLNGNRVSLDTLLAASTAQKRILGPDGNYLTSDSNTIAQDWSSGRRRGLIEAIWSTNYWVNSEAPGSATVSSTWAISNAADSLFGTLNRCTLTASVSGDSIVSVISGLSSGDVTTVTIALKDGTGSWSRVGIYGTAVGDWGADADSWATIISGPGTLTRNQGALWNISGATSDTVVRVSRIHRAAESAYAICYTNTTPGQTVSFGRPQFEKGYGSSYIPCGASSTARAADVVTAASGLLALFKATNAALVLRGSVLDAGTPWSSILGGNAGGGISTGMSDYTGATFYDAGAAHSLAVSGSVATSLAAFGIGVSYTDVLRKACVTGGSIFSDNYGLFPPSETGVVFGSGPSGARNILLDEIIVWPILASNAGLQAQARVYS